MANGTPNLEMNTHSPKKEREKPLLWNQTPSTRRSEEAEIDPALARLVKLLIFLGIDQSTSFRVVYGFFIIFVLGIAVPAVAIWATTCTNCRRFEVTKFEVMAEISSACLSALSMLCMAHNLKKYGLRKFLFVEVHHPVVRFRYDVKTQIRESFSLLKWVIFPCFVVKVIREVLRIIHLHLGALRFRRV